MVQARRRWNIILMDELGNKMNADESKTFSSLQVMWDTVENIK
jgi:hypothetical protein